MNESSVDTFLARAAEQIRPLNSYLDSETLLSRIARLVQQMMGADSVLLVGIEEQLLDPVEHTDEWPPQAYSLRAVRKALQSDQGYWHGNIEEDPSDSQLVHNILSCMSARMDCGAKTIGVVYCDIRDGEHRFCDQDGVRLKLLADLLSVYLDGYLFRHRSPETNDPKAPASIDDLLIGQAPNMRKLKDEIQRAAKLPSTSVLIRGERGCGKEIVAQLVHSLSDRCLKELVVVHCASITKELFESEFFGHERGAFTGAVSKRKGKVRTAEGGTLFLDEVADAPLEFQIKLLRLLQSKTFYRVGSDIPVGPVDVRFVFATNRNLEKMMQEGILREDFCDRLNMGKVIDIPPLRDRLEDVPLLSRYFAKPAGISEEAMDLLCSVEDWPGNVRQLESVVRAAGASSEGGMISRQSVQKELEARRLLNQAEPINRYLQLKQQYKDGVVTASQVRDFLVSRFKSHNAWSRVARNLGCSTPDEVKSFQQWVFNLQRIGLLPKDLSDPS